MSKVMVVLVPIALIACNRRLPSSGVQKVNNPEEVSEAIMKSSFENVGQLSEFLENQGAEHTLTTVTEDDLMVAPTSCANRVGLDFKFAYLRLEGTSGPKLYRYRLYWQQAGPLCIEEDFSFKNPYEL